MDRRRFLRGAAATTAATVVGFDVSSRLWVSEAEARSHFHRVPALEGELVMASEALESFSTDAGYTVFRQPLAVLRPASSEDIAKMVRYCRVRRIPVAARGQGHTTFGQSLAALMIDMSTLAAVHSIDAHEARVDAGIMWRDLLAESLVLGAAPPNLTSFIGLSVGGTLSVGGISAGPDRGAQVDRVFELEVVTGRGEIVRCSERDNRGLFMAALGGLGQCGIITQATVELVPAMERARTYQLPYFDNATFFADMRTLLARNELDDVYCLWVPGGPSGWTYVLHAIKFYDSDSPPDPDHLLRGLSYFEPGAQTVDETYHSYALTVDRAIEQLTAAGLWEGVMHPWFDAFLPDRTVEQYIGEVLPTLTPEDVGVGGFMLLFPKRSSHFTRPFLRIPDDDWVYLFDILTARDMPGYDAEYAKRMLARNRSLFDKAAAMGGTRYPIGSLDFTQRDWARHYRETYFGFWALQRYYDPSRILTPGLKIRP